MVRKDIIMKFVSTGILAAILLFIGLTVPQLLGFAGGGFEKNEILEQFDFYIPLTIGYLIGVFILFIVVLILARGDRRYGSTVLFNSPGSLIPLPKILRNPFGLVIISAIVFTILALITVLRTQTTFTGLAVLPQQFTPTESLLFSSALIPVAENLGLAFVIALTFVFVLLIARKINMSKANFIIILFVLIPIVSGVYGLANHSIAYPDSETDKLIVFGFWSMSGLITVISGSFIPAWIAHIDNNLFIDLARLFASDAVRNWTIGIIFILILSLVIIIFTSRRIRKRRFKG